MSGSDPIPFWDLLLDGPLRLLEPLEQDIFHERLEAGWPDVLRPLDRLYGERGDYERWLLRLVEIVAEAYAARPAELRRLDLRRIHRPDWFQQPNMIGYICYADRFAGDLAGIIPRIPYLKELGVTYLHVMPLLQPRPDPNDGGYAVADYRAINAPLGTMDDLRALTQALRAQSVSLCTDLVLNHTAKEHPWAVRAMAGDERYQDYYLTFPDRTLPDQYERTVPEVFPDFAPGNFTYYEELGRWVWTTFNEYQWDLNYTNPAVFAEMLDIMLFLANQGVEILRLDAVAFMWKRLGTDSQNQPEAHWLLQAFRALTRIAAPGLLFKAEAIVSSPQLIPYLGRGYAANKECELAYHNVLMVLIWSALAERRVTLMTRALQEMPALPENAAWVTYVRCHDDIGWAVTDEDAAAVGLSGPLHRAFLSDFYSGRFPDTFARGATFQFNPRTGDRRISGSCASLAGLETAIARQSAAEADLAIRRILLAHNLILAFGGIPLIYMGDELGLLNDYDYESVPEHADDNRWLHRPRMDWEKAADRERWQTFTGRIFAGMRHLAQTRAGLPPLHAQARAYPVWSDNDAVFGLLRDSARGRLLVLANFTERAQTVPAYRLGALGFAGTSLDHLTGQSHHGWQDLTLSPYQAVWLEQM